MFRSSQVLFSLKSKRKVCVRNLIIILVQGFVKPNLSTVRYDDTNVAQIKDGQLRKAVIMH